MMKTIELEARQELLFKVKEEPVKLELRKGQAEVYGTEMLANKSYTFPRKSKASVYTYHGATIEMTGTPEKSHVSRNCDHMTCYLSIHRDLERMREEAERSSQAKFAADDAATDPNRAPLEATNLSNPQQQPLPAGDPGAESANTRDSDRTSSKPDLSQTPICLVCEPLDAKNVGKSTLCRILLNYAARRGRVPIFVDLDPDQGHIGLPGTIGALSVESPIDIETGLNAQLKSSMLLHFGHTNPAADAEGKSGLCYKAIVDNMAKIVHSRLEQDKKSYYSGAIINTSSWTDNGEYKILVDACKSFRANMVLVVDDEVLQGDLQKDLSEGPTPVRVINVPKTVEIYKMKNPDYVDYRYTKIKEYFYGTESEELKPMTSEMKFSYLKKLIYRVSNPLMLSDALMPLGRKQQDSQVKISHHNCTAHDLLHHILAISFAQIDDVVERAESVLSNNIMGFICITSVRADGEIVSILTPQKLPNPLDHVLLYSEVQYMDSLI